MSDLPDAVDVAILGAGFAGIGMAAQLRRSGRTNFVVLERAERIGGTWRDNTYPGCACDIPSLLYSYSFGPDFPWSRTYPRQEEIWAYLALCVDHFKLLEHIRFRSDVRRATYDAGTSRWTIACADGRTVISRILVLGMGGLNRPSLPNLPGAGQFRGFAFHSSQWDHRVEFAGKRIAIIGTGASSIQIVPELAKTAAHVALFQRTPAWIVASHDRRLAPGEIEARQKRPVARRLKRWLIYWRQELLAFGFTVAPRLMKSAEHAALEGMRRAIESDELRQQLTPHYQIGCKRILISNDFYPALAKPSVTLYATSVEALDERGVIAADGRHVDVDGIVFATGFKSVEMLGDTDVVGTSGESLRNTWRDRALAYLGIMVHGYPNLFLLVGPNTGLGHNSIVFMIEAQVHFVLQALDKMDATRSGSIDVRADVQEGFARYLRKRFLKTVWSQGCNSWYLDARGQNFALWPSFSASYWMRTRRLRSSHFILSR